MADTAELDAETESVWDRWFSLEDTSIEEAMSAFQIDVEPKRTKEDEAIEGADDVPVQYEFFSLTNRPKIAEMLDWTERYFWKLKNRAARIICLKCRRYGVSTFWLLFGLERVLRVPGYQALLIAQDDASTGKHFQRLRDVFAQIPKAVLKARGIEVIKDTDRQLVLRHGGHKTSEFHVAPAKRGALGRGARYNLIIVTEFPHYPKSAKKDLSGVLAACRNVRGNAIVFEATAKGFEEYHRRYVRAAKRRSDYRAQFIAAQDHPDNRKPFDSPEAEDAFIKSIGTVPEFGIEDELVLFRRLTVDLRWTPHDAAEHLNWRRAEIADVCEGVIEFYKRENPSTPEEAFSGTGMPIFRKEILEAWRDAAQAREEKARVGDVRARGDDVRFEDFRNGPLTMFEEPVPGELYAFGADVASGVAVHADGKTEADFSVMNVKHAKTKKTVARYRTHIPPAEFAEAVFRIAVYYNGARGFIERAMWDSGVAIDRFEDQEIGKFTGYELILSQKVDIKSDVVNQRANAQWKPGFSTTQKTKPRLVAHIDKHIKDTGLPDGVKECPWDVVTIDECGKFERDEQSGRMESAEGHDDCVISEGMSDEACIRVLEDAVGEAPPPPKKNADPGWEILMRHAQGVRDQERRGEEETPQGEVDGLHGF